MPRPRQRLALPGRPEVPRSMSASGSRFDFADGRPRGGSQLSMNWPFLRPQSLRASRRRRLLASGEMASGWAGTDSGLIWPERGPSHALSATQDPDSRRAKEFRCRLDSRCPSAFLKPAFRAHQKEALPKCKSPVWPVRKELFPALPYRPACAWEYSPSSWEKQREEPSDPAGVLRKARDYAAFEDGSPGNPGGRSCFAGSGVREFAQV